MTLARSPEPPLDQLHDAITRLITQHGQSVTYAPLDVAHVADWDGVTTIRLRATADPIDQVWALYGIERALHSSSREPVVIGARRRGHLRALPD